MFSTVLTIILAGLSFFFGIKYSEYRSPDNSRFSGGQQARAGYGAFGSSENGNGGQKGVATGRNLFRGMGGANGGMTAGEISNIENGMLTLKTPDGGSKLIIMSSSTKVMQMSEIKQDAMKDSMPVFIIGKKNTDGSITAETVQIRQTQ